MEMVKFKFTDEFELQLPMLVHMYFLYSYKHHHKYMNFRGVQQLTQQIDILLEALMNILFDSGI